MARTPGYGMALVESPRLPDGSFGFVDRTAVQDFSHGDGVAPRHLTLWPSLPARILTVAGAAVAEIVLVQSVLDALRASNWEHPRPVIGGDLALAAAVMLAGAVWWMLTAVHNVHGVAPRKAIGPSLVLMYAVPVVAWVAVDRMVEGDVRRWAWAAWVALAVVVHYLVVVAFRAVSATLGQPDSHLTAVAVLPVCIALTAVPAVFQRVAVFALPVAGAMAAWLLVELWQAMAEWDHTCARRMGVERPVRRRPAPVELPPKDLVMAARTEVAVEERHHHTLLPRAMVLTSFVLGASAPAWVVLLERKHHLEWAGRDTSVDAVGRHLLITLFVSTFGTYAVGWLWWSAAAAANAASRARWTVSPLLAPFGYLVTVGVVAALPEVDRRIDPSQRPVAAVVGGLVIVIAHFGVLRAYRRTAESIGAELRPWARVIALPWATLACSLLLAFFGQVLDQSVFTLVLGTMWVCCYLAYATSMYQAMAAFDRACTGRRLVHGDDDGLPEFVSRARRSGLGGLDLVPQGVEHG